MKTIFAAVLVVGCFYLVNCKVNFNAPVKIKWVWVNTRKGASPRITQNLEPAGYEGPGNSSFICRANVIDRQGIKLWVPGKLIGEYSNTVMFIMTNHRLPSKYLTFGFQSQAGFHCLSTIVHFHLKLLLEEIIGTG